MKNSKAVGVFAIFDIHERAEFARLEGNVLVVEEDFELLFADFVWTRPVLIIFFQYFRVYNNPFKLLQYYVIDIDLFPY